MRLLALQNRCNGWGDVFKHVAAVRTILPLRSTAGARTCPATAGIYNDSPQQDDAMNPSQLTASVAGRVSLSWSRSERAVNALAETIGETHVGGLLIEVRAWTAPSFKSSKTLRDAINR